MCIRDRFWVLALYLLLWYAAVPAQDVPVPGLPQGRYRVWCALAALLCAALAFAGCLVWTPKMCIRDRALTTR